MNSHLVTNESWQSYGQTEPVVQDFLRQYPMASLHVTTVDIYPDGEMCNESLITDYQVLNEFTKILPDPSKTSLRILLVKELSAEGLQILGTNLGIHLGFWTWVTSKQASDSYWLNTHNDGKILSFDWPCFEFYSSPVAPLSRVVREGRLKHLSSRHRLFGGGLSTDSEGYEAYINRRVSGYLIPTNGMHTFIFLSEDCLSVSSFQMYPTRESHPISTEWFLKELKSMDLSYRKLYVEEPLGLVLDIMKELIRTWHVFTVYLQRDLENIDGNLPESLPVELPEHNLYDIGTYLHRDVVQTLFRFSQHLGKFEGYLKYLYDGTKDNFRPKVFMNNAKNLNNNVIEIGRRLAASKERANMSLTLINNYIALQQTRLASEQARISTLMAEIQLRDSQSSRRLSVVATVFLPLSFATSWLSTNGTTPFWIFVPIAVISVAATTVIVMFLKWNEPSSMDSDSRIWILMKRRLSWFPVQRKGRVPFPRNTSDSMV